MDIRVGQGFDIHRMAAGRPCVIGGIVVESEVGPIGHSDADPLLHAIIDAILGATGKGDIGEHFPDTEDRWKDAKSSDLLFRVVELVNDDGWTVSNLDATVIAEKPRLSLYKEQMRAHISHLLEVKKSSVSIKAKTHEGIGALGHGEAIAVHCSVLLIRDFIQ